MNWISEWVYRVSGIDPTIFDKVLTSVVIILSVWLVNLLAREIINSRVKEIRSRYVWRKTLSVLNVVLTLILVSRIWIEGLGSVLTYFGLVSAGLVVVLKDLIENMAGWIYIIWIKPFSVGDRIQLTQHIGDVIDIRLFHFTILEIGNWVEADQSTGRIIHIPNNRVFRDPQINYHKGFEHIWNEVAVNLTFESNWISAKKILEEIGKKHSHQQSRKAERTIEKAMEQYYIFYSKLTSIVYTSVMGYGIRLTLRYLCDPRQRRSTEHKIWEDILQRFSMAHDISFAYQTYRIHQEKTTECYPIQGNFSAEE